MGVLKSVPGITLIDPCDPVEFAAALRMAKEKPGMFYVRYSRKAVPTIYEAGSEFECGKGVVLRDGSDATVIASGIMVDETLAAADQLAGQGVKVRVVDMFTWKPIDEELICRCAEETGAIVTAENHNTYSGLGSTVACVLAKRRPAPIEMVGVNDSYGQVGMLDFQKKVYGMTTGDIVEKVLKAMARK